MSGELAVPDDGPLGGGDVLQTVAKLRAAREYVWGSPEGDALKAKRDAETLRHWARINKAAADIAIEACRLQATALRRLGQLGSREISGQELQIAIWLASMKDRTFESLMNGMKYARSPQTIWNDYRRRMDRNAKLDRGREIAEGYGDPPDMDSVCRAATHVLQAAMARGATTVNELTLELANCLGYGDVDLGDSVIREGVETVIRESLRAENISGEAHPDFVTWKDREAGWLRIPWPAATLDQLRWMAEFREEQARELAEAAETLRILVRDLDEVKADNRHLTRLNDLWAALQVALNAEDEAA